MNYNGAECWVGLYRVGTIEPKPGSILALPISKNSTPHSQFPSVEVTTQESSLIPLSFYHQIPLILLLLIPYQILLVLFLCVF